MTPPRTELDQRYSVEGAEPTPWSAASDLLGSARIAHLATLRPDGPPHLTPLIFVWVDDRLLVHTGPEEQKARNLAADPQCTLMVGTGSADDGLDVVLEADAVVLRDDADLHRFAEALETKYGTDWHYDVVDGELLAAGDHRPIVVELVPKRGYGFRKDPSSSHTRWTFAE